ncbi:MAG: hypothetical protein LUD74_03860 [Tannerellaceae bacterium]|nr:hypothetical protein [Tannerellaceae bacterium]
MRRRINQLQSLQPPKVGDFVYSDRTWSTEYNANKTCVGICFYVNVTDRRMVSIIDAGSDSGRSMNGNTNNTLITSLANVQTKNAALEDFKGKSNTGALYTHFVNNSWYKPGFTIYDVLNYSTPGFGRGEWWLPACGELNKIFEQRAIIDNNCVKAGGKAFLYGNRMIYVYHSSTPYKYDDGKVVLQYMWALNYSSASAGIIEYRGTGGNWYFRAVTSF